MRIHHAGIARAVASTIALGIIAIVSTASAQHSSAAQGKSAAAAAAPITPRAAFDSLTIGNRRFYTGKLLKREYPQDIGRADTMHPFAAIFGCMDSRTPTDLMFDRGLGETFGLRVAGNVADTDIVGSLEYAVEVKKVVLVAVIGHSDCGAVKGAISNVQLGNLTALLKKIEPAIRVVPPNIRPRDTSNPAFVQAVADSNVTQTMKRIRELSPILRQAFDSGRVMLVGGMYNVKNGQVTFFRPMSAAQGSEKKKRE